MVFVWDEIKNRYEERIELMINDAREYDATHYR